MPELVEVAARFLLIGALAFGGGQAALPLVERLTVGETGWLTPKDFAAGIGLAYATPGPVLILAAFVGYRAAGMPGALVGTVAVFAVPVLLAAAAARVVGRLAESRRFRVGARHAVAAAIGLLGVTLVALGRPLIEDQPVLLLGSAMVLIAAARGISPVLLIGIAASAGVIGSAV